MGFGGGGVVVVEAGMGVEVFGCGPVVVKEGVFFTLGFELGEFCR